KISFNIVHRISLKRVLYTFELDKNTKYLLMACQSLKIFDIDSKEIVKTLKPISKVGFIFKIALDPLNKFICASCMDKSIMVYDFSTGNCLATLYSNLVTSLCFTLDCQKLITVTGDGCLFIWKNINEDVPLDGFNEDFLPTWAKKVASRSANIVMSTKSIVPKGKWASRMEKTISIRTVSTSDESEASASTPLSSHSDVNRYFEEHPIIREEEITKMESPSSNSRDFSEEPQEMKPPIAPPRRKHRKGRGVQSQASNSSEFANSSTTSITKTNFVGFGVRKATNVVTKEDVKSNATKKSNIFIQKREKASQVIGQVKEMLETIDREGQLRNSISMFDLSKPPPKGTWLSTYRTSVGEEKNQLWKQKSMSNLANSKSYSSENLNRLKNNSKDQNKRDNQAVNANLNSGTRYVKKRNNPGDKPSLSRPRPRLSLPKSNLLERTQTDPEIITRQKLSSKTNVEEKVKSVKKVLDIQIDYLSGNEGGGNSPKRETNSRLSLLKSHSLSRTQTDPEIIVRKKEYNESNLAKINQTLSASNSEINRTESLRDINISTAKITEQLCEAVGNELVNTATKAVELYRRFTKGNTLSKANINALENLALSLVWAKIKLERLDMQKNKH
ncbi:WD40 domain-containing protein, partial [Oryctes borbonicus]